MKNLCAFANNQIFDMSYEPVEKEINEISNKLNIDKSNVINIGPHQYFCSGYGFYYCEYKIYDNSPRKFLKIEYVVNLSDDDYISTENMNMLDYLGYKRFILQLHGHQHKVLDKIELGIENWHILKYRPYIWMESYDIITGNINWNAKTYKYTDDYCYTLQYSNRGDSQFIKLFGNDALTNYDMLMANPKFVSVAQETSMPDMINWYYYGKQIEYIQILKMFIKYSLFPFGYNSYHGSFYNRENFHHGYDVEYVFTEKANKIVSELYKNITNNDLSLYDVLVLLKEKRDEIDSEISGDVKATEFVIYSKNRHDNNYRLYYPKNIQGNKFTFREKNGFQGYELTMDVPPGYKYIYYGYVESYRYYQDTYYRKDVYQELSKRKRKQPEKIIESKKESH